MEKEDIGEFSRLASGFARLEVERRPVSVHVQEPSRHFSNMEMVNDLELNYEFNKEGLPPNLCHSLQGIFSATQYHSHISNLKNFSEETDIVCFDQTNDKAAFHTLDSSSLSNLLATIEEEENSLTPTPAPRANPEAVYARSPTPGPCGSDPNIHYTNSKPPSMNLHLSSTPQPTANAIKPLYRSDGGGRLLVFFVPLIPNPDASFSSQVSMTRPCVQRLFEAIGANPEYLLNLLGRPDYWAPRTRWQVGMDEKLAAVDYFCQHPRWNQQTQGAPLSVYMIRRVETKLTAYIISHKAQDTSVHGLKEILRIGTDPRGMSHLLSSSFQNPFEIAVLLSSLSHEASKYHVGKFRRYMWAQVNKVDDHLTGSLESNQRHRLTELTKSLQIIAQHADAHLLNAEVAILTAQSTRDVQAKLHDHLSTPTPFRQPAEDAINYVISSMQKQKMLFLNYKNRKDGTMGLVFNLVTQSDAANNISLAKSMKRDSTSMSAIALLTMIFLPGTFTSTVLGAGVFSAQANIKGISISGLWWLWVALTLPLTSVVVGCYFGYMIWSDRKKRVVVD